MRKRLIIISIFLLWTMVYRQWTINAAVPRIINYQARLVDKDGKALEDEHTIVFGIYDTAGGGAPLWEEERKNLDIERGVLSVMLGDVKDLELPFDRDYYLQIKVDNEVMNERQRITSVGYAIKAETAETANQAVNAATVAGYSVSAGDAAAAGKIPVMNAKGYLPDASVDITALKTATGEVSASGGNIYNLTLPGGEYGFYPQVKGTGSVEGTVQIAGEFSFNYQFTSSYVTKICLYLGGYGTAYAQQRYITASGEDYWIFLLVDRKTEEIIAASAAPDHPSYGNGGDYNKVTQPFGDYDESKHIIVLVEGTQAKELQKQASEERGVAQIVNEDYRVDFSEKYEYVPLHSGKYIDKDGKQIKHIVENIPDNITVRKLVKLTAGERKAKEEQTQERAKEYNERKAQAAKKRETAIEKLEALGLTEEDVRVIMEKQQ